MRALVVYDSQFGNTEKIAMVIAKAIKAKAKVVTQVTDCDYANIDLLVVGSPTQGGRPTVAIQQFLNRIPNKSLDRVQVAAFDTRFLEENLGFWLRLLVKTIGYAAPKIAKELVRKGATLKVAPAGFVVTNTKGPLASGESKRASNWL